MWEGVLVGLSKRFESQFAKTRHGIMRFLEVRSRGSDGVASESRRARMTSEKVSP